MARNDLGELSVLGLEANSMPELSDEIQTNLIDKWAGTHHVQIAERYFHTPQSLGGKYTALIFYVIEEKPAPVEEATAEPVKKGKKA